MLKHKVPGPNTLWQHTVTIPYKPKQSSAALRASLASSLEGNISLVLMLEKIFFHFHSCPRPGLLRTGCQCLKREKSLGEQEPLGWGWGLSGPCGGCPRGAGRCRGAASRSCSLPKEPLPQKVPVCSDGDRSYSCTMIYHIL